MKNRHTPRQRSTSDTAVHLRDGEAERSDFELLVIVKGAVLTYPLARSGQVTIGRGSDNVVQIDDTLVSRHHARLLLGERVRIEDLGSTNGVSIRGTVIKPNKPTELRSREVVEIGNSMLMLQRSQLITRDINILSHGHFERRMDEACRRSDGSSSELGLVRLSFKRNTPGDEIYRVLARNLGREDVLGLYRPGEYEVLLSERSANHVAELTRTLGEKLAKIGMPPRIRFACFPRDGRSAQELLARVSDDENGADTGRADRFIVVKARAMRELHEFVAKIAASDTSVLILGETGVGKEVIAEGVHRCSPRRDKPFLRLNGAALSESLLESELFGHEKGSFTGAHQTKKGLLETAQGGTIFLDEIGDLSPAAQIKLLRVLDQREAWRVGSLAPYAIDVRFVTATHRDLTREIALARFRRDLYFRLNGVSVFVPPLRERKEEIAPMAEEFVRHFLRRQGASGEPVMEPEVVAVLESYDWPGNVRELRNTMERAAALALGGTIRPEHLALEKMSSSGFPDWKTYPGRRVDELTELTPDPRTNSGWLPPSVNLPPGDATEHDLALPRRVKQKTRELERERIMEALRLHGGNQTRAAKALGISRRTMVSRLDQYDIPRPLKNSKEK